MTLQHIEKTSTHTTHKNLGPGVQYQWHGLISRTKEVNTYNTSQGPKTDGLTKISIA